MTSLQQHLIALYIITQLIILIAFEVESITIPILQMKKLSHREVK